MPIALDDLPPFLPATDDALDALDAEEAVACAVAQLEPLSTTDDDSFWGTKAGRSPALQDFLDGYLRFAERRFALTGFDASSTDDSASLRRLVLCILLRLAKPPAPLAPWAERFFTVPRLVDLCALYAFTDAPICERLAVFTMGSQAAAKAAALHSSLGDAATAVCQVCGFGSAHTEVGGAVRSALLPSVLDVRTAQDAAIVGDWLLDATGTLHALTLGLPPSAVHTSAASSNGADGGAPAGASSLVPLHGVGGVLTALQLTVEVGLPWLRRAALPTSGGSPADMAAGLARLPDALAACGLHCLHAAANLILASCFECQGAGAAAAAPGGRGRGAPGRDGNARGAKGGGGGGKGKGGSKGKGGGGRGGGGRGDAAEGYEGSSEARALLDLEALTSVLLQLSDPCDAIDGLASTYAAAQVGTEPATRRGAPACLVEGSGALLQQLLRFTELGACVEAVLSSVPAATADYLRSMVARVDERASRGKGKGKGGGKGGGVGGAKGGGGKGGSGGGSFVEEVTAAERESAAMIGEMLPGCGEGFLVAVLRHYGGRSEPALNALLDGTLPPFLDAMPRDLAKPPPPLGADEGATDGAPVGAPLGAAAAGGAPAGGAPRRHETLAQRRARQEEARFLADLSAPGRRAPRGVLEAAAADPGMGAAEAPMATDAFGNRTYSRGGDGGGLGGGGGGELGGAPSGAIGAVADEALLARQDSAALAALYEDELDDSLEAYSAEGRTAGPALHEDQEEANQAVRRGGQGGSSAAAVLFAGSGAGGGAGAGGSGMPSAGAGGSGSGAGAGSVPLPATALEWVRSIGLGQYVESLRAAGIVRLELAAKLSEPDVARLKIRTEAHKTKLLQSAARLAERLTQRGRLPPPGSRAATEEVYAAAAQIHYDAETGQFWDEGGSLNAAPDAGAEGAGKGGAAGGGGSSGGKGAARPPPALGVQRARAEANKAKLANHSRKQGAARKQARAGGFS